MKPQNPYLKYYNDPDSPDGKSICTAYSIWFEGFDAAIKWANEPCTEEGKAHLRGLKHKTCPPCWKGLTEEK